MIGASSDGSGAYQYTWRTSTGDVPALRAIAFAALDLCHAHPGQAKQDWASKTLDNTASAAQKLGAPSGHPFSASMPLSQPDNLASMWMLSQTDLASVMFWVAYVRAWLQVRYLQAKNTRLQEKLALAERSAAASMAQKVCPLIISRHGKLIM